MTAEEECKLYQKIGEFTVSFQWAEQRVREIGWFCNDPFRKNWPPTILREESNNLLLKRVENFFLMYVDKLNLSDASDRKARFQLLIQKCHDLRRRRNIILHSAYVELKAGGEIMDIMRVSSRIQKDDQTGEYVFDREMLNQQSFDLEMSNIVEIALELNFHYTQLLHWPQVDIHN